MNTKVTYLELLLELSRKEVKVRYKNSYFGYLWSVAHPLALTLVFFFAFKLVIGIPEEEYALFIICGLFPWQWFQNSVTASTTTFIRNATLIKKVFFPRDLLVSAAVLSELAHFLVCLPIITAMVFVYGRRPSAIWLAGLPLLIGIQMMMTYGVSLFVSTINLFFRDIERLVTVLLTLLFYFTPVIYSYSLVPEQYRVYMNLNPLAPLIVSYRRLFLDNTLDGHNILTAFGYSAVLLLLGYLVYSRLKWRFAELV